MRPIPRRLACGLAVVLAWLGFVVGGSHALFSDSATLANNGITTGTVDLLISNSQAASSTTYADSRPGFSYVLSPGVTEDRFILLKNASVTGVSMDIAASVPLAGIDQAFASLITVRFLPVDASGVAVSSPVEATMQQLTKAPLSLSGVAIQQGGTQRVKISLSLAPEYAQQNSTQTYDLVFTGTQRLS